MMIVEVFCGIFANDHQILTVGTSTNIYLFTNFNMSSLELTFTDESYKPWISYSILLLSASCPSLDEIHPEFNLLLFKKLDFNL